MKKILLILIVLFALLLRFYKIDSLPALNADEAAIGYNVYSLIQNGRDEHENIWPIHFQSFNDYKPGLYFYLVLPFVKMLGLNIWAVRLPGVLLGGGTVLAVYYLANELFKSRQIRIRSWEFSIGHLVSLMLAVSPWHIHFSRGGWEVNASTFSIVLGVLFFLKSLVNSRNLILCSVFLVLSLYTYHSARVIVPLLGLGLLAIYKSEIFKTANVKPLLFTTLLTVVLLFPLAKDLMGPAGLSRATGVGLFADVGPYNRINEQRGEHSDLTGLPAKILHNKVINYGLAFMENWGKHYWGEFMFLSGDDIQRNKVPETGQMHLVDLVFILIGIVAMSKNMTQGTKLIFFWLAVAPIASSLTFQSPHALRAHNMVIPLVTVSAIGLFETLLWLNSIRSRHIFIVGYVMLVSVICLSVMRYLHMYYVHMAKEYPYSSQYGAKELAEYVSENREKYDKILITDRYDQPYILLLFYLKYSPQDFQKNHELTQRDQFGFSTVRDFDKYHFAAIDFDIVKPQNPGSLIIGTDEEIPDEANVVKEIYGSNGFKYFQVVAN